MEKHRQPDGVVDVAAALGEMRATLDEARTNPLVLITGIMEAQSRLFLFLADRLAQLMAQGDLARYRMALGQAITALDIHTTAAMYDTLLDVVEAEVVGDAEE